MTATWRNRIVLAGPLLAALVLLLVRPSDDGPTICPFALCTGTACPGCGMTRAGASLIRGDFAAAFAYHPLVVAVTLQLAAGWIWYLLRRSGRVQPLRARTLNAILIGTGIVLVGVWVARLLTGALPPV